MTKLEIEAEIEKMKEILAEIDKGIMPDIEEAHKLLYAARDRDEQRLFGRRVDRLMQERTAMRKPFVDEIVRLSAFLPLPPVIMARDDLPAGIKLEPPHDEA